MKVLVCLFLLLNINTSFASVLIKPTIEADQIKCHKISDVGNVFPEIVLYSEEVDESDRTLVFSIKLFACMRLSDKEFGFREINHSDEFTTLISHSNNIIKAKKFITYIRFFHTHTGLMDKYSDVEFRDGRGFIVVKILKNLSKITLGPVITSSVYIDDYNQVDGLADFGPAKFIEISN